LIFGALIFCNPNCFSAGEIYFATPRNLNRNRLYSIYFFELEIDFIELEIDFFEMDTALVS